MVKVIYFDYHGVLDRHTFRGLLETMGAAWAKQQGRDDPTVIQQFVAQEEGPGFDYASGVTLPQLYWGRIAKEFGPTIDRVGREYLLHVQPVREMWNLISKLHDDYHVGLFTDCSLDKNLTIPGTNRQLLSVAGNSRFWLFGGTDYGTPPTYNDRHGILFRYENGALTDLSAQLGPNLSVCDVKWNGSYFLISTCDALYTYDGTTLTDVTDSLPSSQRPINAYNVRWNGSYWLIGGIGHEAGSYNGTTYRPYAWPTTLPNEGFTTAAVGNDWLVGFLLGSIYTWDGTTLTKLNGPADLKGIQTVSSNGKEWVVAGYDTANYPVIYRYNRSTFTKVTLPMPGFTTDVLWDGSRWLAAATPLSGGTPKLYAIDTTTNAITTLRTLFSNDEFAGASGSSRVGKDWIMAGNTVSNGSWSPFIVINTNVYASKQAAVSKRVATTSKKITSVTLTPTQTVPAGTSIVYDVSVNDGKTWQRINAGVATKMKPTGKQLRWRATLKTTDAKLTPTIKKIVLSYKF